MSKLSEVHFVRTTFAGNYVEGGRVTNQGGALYLAPGVRFDVNDSDLRNNSANGVNPVGGAIWSATEFAVLVNTSLLQNRVVVSGLQGHGGAIHVSAGFLRLDACRVHDNVAQSLGGSNYAWGGAFHVLAGALHIQGSSLRGNRMGGLGVGQAEVSTAAGGAHVYAEVGDVVLDSCNVADGGSGEEARLENAAKWWLLALQSLALRNSSFRGATPGQGLLQMQGPQLQLLIRGCAFENVTIGVADGASVQPIGIVDSTFAPALDPSIPTVLPTGGSGACAVQRAGERVCDARATCKGAWSGGVQCSCTESGLRESSSSVSNGWLCFQDTSVIVDAKSQNLVLQAKKPGVADGMVQFVVTVSGESPVAVQYSMSQTRSTRVPGLPFVNTVRNWSQFDDADQSLDGHHITWEAPPVAGTVFWLDGAATKFLERQLLSFRIRLGCDLNESCVADGDSVETVFEVFEPGSRSLMSAVRVTTLVQSMVSCENSRVFFVDNAQATTAVKASRSIELMLEARDVDMMPLRFTPVAIRCTFGERPCDVDVSTFGKHLYSITVPADLTQNAGMHELVISLIDGWNTSAGRQAPCVVFRHTVAISASFNTIWMVAISGGVALFAVLVGGLVVKFKVSRDRSQHDACRV
jgi:hypothetical protein